MVLRAAVRPCRLLTRMAVSLRHQFQFLGHGNATGPSADVAPGPHGALITAVHRRLNLVECTLLNLAKFSSVSSTAGPRLHGIDGQTR